MASEQVEITEEELKRVHEQFEKHVAEIEGQYKSHMVEHAGKAVMFCQATYKDDHEDTLKCVQRVSPNVDYTIIVEDGSLTEEQKNKLQTYPNVQVKTVQFKDSLPEYRNAYVEEAKKIDPHGWVLVSDPDELMSESLCLELKNIVKALEEEGYNMAGINCREAFECVEWLDNLDLLKELPSGYRQSNFFKNILFKLSPNLRYIGIGKSRTVHETWHALDLPWRVVNLDTRFYYEHKKSALKIWRNAARNVFMGGGGDNMGDLIPEWSELKAVCAELGINTWQQYEDYLKKGNIGTRLKDFLIKCLTLPGTNWGTEYREMAKWYFAMHKDEATPEIMEKIKTVPPIPKESDVEAWITKCYFDILGRHPDEMGKRIYTEHILAGRIKREDLPNILQASPEYKEKLRRAFQKITVGAIVLAKNEEKNIEKCLKHLKPYVDFLFVLVDSETTDKTIEISKKYADATLVKPFSGSFSAERNYAQNLIPTEWVLHCDADETFDEVFLKSMKQIISQTAVESFRFPRINPQKRDYPDYQVRLFRKGNIEWRGKHSERPFSQRDDKPVDQVNIKTLEECPIIHSGDKKDWAKLLG